MSFRFCGSHLDFRLNVAETGSSIDRHVVETSETERMLCKCQCRNSTNYLLATITTTMNGERCHTLCHCSMSSSRSHALTASHGGGSAAAAAGAGGAGLCLRC